MAPMLVSLTCEHCGAAFTLDAWSVRNGQRYCSRACSNSARRPRDPVARFWERVEKVEDSCWLWRGELDRDGYGVFWVRRKRVRAHRLSWELANGAIPEGLVICHDCDRRYPPGDISYRRCVNPDHLFLGTMIENANDMAYKGRAARGDQHGSHLHPERWARGEKAGAAKLTAEIVRELRRQYAAGRLNQREAARRLGVTQTAIIKVVHGETWAHVE